MKLNLGCGRNSLDGYLNLDRKYRGNNKPDIIWDLENGLPIIPDNTQDEVGANMVLEHIKNYEFLMKEIHRVLKHGGILRLAVPDSNGSNAWGDPSHIRGFNITSFRYWARETSEYLSYQPEFEFIIKKCETDGEVITAELAAVKETSK